MTQETKFYPLCQEGKRKAGRWGNRSRPHRSTRAGGTDSAKENLVFLDNESCRGSGLMIERAARDLVHPVACQAVEMMMVAFAGPFIHGTKGGMIDLRQPALIDKQAEIAVHRGLIERSHQQPTLAENLFDGQRPVLIKEDLGNGRSLGSLSSHGPRFVG